MRFDRTYERYIRRLASRQHKPQARFLREMIYGMLARRSVLLSEIGRSLEEPRRLIHTEKRLSRNLGNSRFDDLGIEHSYLEMVSPFLRDTQFPTPIIAVDHTDIIKPRAKKMPYLATVRDGSQGKELGEGYELVTIEGAGKNGRRLPLCWRLFSTAAPEYRGHHPVTFSAIRHVERYVPPNAIWAFDRGFDSRRCIEHFDRIDIQYVIRCVLGYKRAVWFRGEKMPLPDAVEQVALRTMFKSTRRMGIRVGWAPIRLQAFSKAGTALLGMSDNHYSLVVVCGTGQQKMVLLTNMKITGAVMARRIAEAYFDRWGVEEAHRFVKQAFDLENLRALTWRGLKRLVLLSMCAYGFLAVLVHRRRNAIESVAADFKAFGPVPTYVYYRLLEGVAALIQIVV